MDAGIIETETIDTDEVVLPGKPVKVIPVSDVKAYLLDFNTGKHFTKNIDCMVVLQKKRNSPYSLQYVLCNQAGEFKVVTDYANFLCVVKGDDEMTTEYLEALKREVAAEYEKKLHQT